MALDCGRWQGFYKRISRNGKVTLVGEILESKGEEKEGRVEPEGEAVKESRAKDKSKGKEKE